MRRVLFRILLLSGLIISAVPLPVPAYDSYAWGYIDETPEENFVQRMLRLHGTRIMFGLAAAGVVGFLFLMGPGEVFDAWKRTRRMYGYRRGLGGFGGFGGFGGDDW